MDDNIFDGEDEVRVGRFDADETWSPVVGADGVRYVAPDIIVHNRILGKAQRSCEASKPAATLDRALDTTDDTVKSVPVV